MGVSRDCTNFLVPPIISGVGKATNFKFCTHILSIDRNKTPLQISGKVAGCVGWGLSKLFRAPIYWAHRAVFFAIAQLSCFFLLQYLRNIQLFKNSHFCWHIMSNMDVKNFQFILLCIVIIVGFQWLQPVCCLSAVYGSFKAATCEQR